MVQLGLGSPFERMRPTPQITAAVLERLRRLGRPEAPPSPSSRSPVTPDQAEPGQAEPDQAEHGQVPAAGGDPAEAAVGAGPVGVGPVAATGADASTADSSTSSRLRRGHVVIVALLLLVALVGAVVLVVRNRPVPEPLPITTVPPSSGAASSRKAGAASPSAAPPSAAAILVHVAGKVRHPGVVRLKPGDRVIDAIEAAGGAESGVGVLNLARPLVDGEQIVVGVTRSPGRVPSSVPRVGGSDQRPVSLNRAPLEELEQLPGVGPVLAQRILDFRIEHGRFTSVDELREVSGIGEQRLADLRDQVTVP